MRSDSETRADRMGVCSNHKPSKVTLFSHTIFRANDLEGRVCDTTNESGAPQLYVVVFS